VPPYIKNAAGAPYKN